MMGGCFVLMLLILIVYGVFGDEVSVTVKEGDSVTLNSDVTKKQQNDTMRWFFNNILIAHVNGDPSKSCLYDGEGGIFRDRLKVVNYESGSLTITNIRSEHTGYYEAEFIRKNSTGKSSSLNRTSKCDRTRITNKTISADDDIIKSFRLIVSVPDSTLSPAVVGSGLSPAVVGSGLSPAVVAGIVGVVLLVFVGVGVILYRRWTANKGEKKNSQGTDEENKSQGTDGENSQDSLMKPEV